MQHKKELQAFTDAMTRKDPPEDWRNQLPPMNHQIRNEEGHMKEAYPPDGMDKWEHNRYPVVEQHEWHGVYKNTCKHTSTCYTWQKDFTYGYDLDHAKNGSRQMDQFTIGRTTHYTHGKASDLSRYHRHADGTTMISKETELYHISSTMYSVRRSTDTANMITIVYFG